MLNFYHQLAIKLRSFRWLLLLISLCAILCFISLIIFATPAQAQQWQLTSIVIAIIGLLAYLISLLFARPIIKIVAQHSFIYRVKIRLQQTFSYLLALILSLIVLAVLFLVLRALLGIIRSLFFS